MINLFQDIQSFLPNIVEPSCYEFINFISINNDLNLSSVCDMQINVISNFLYDIFYGYQWNSIENA